MNKLTLLVTRPDPAGSALCQMINAAGDQAVHVPTIAFAPPADEKAVAIAMQHLDEQDSLIFISPQAVYASMPRLKQSNLRSDVSMVAVGAGTARALSEAGYQTVIYPDDEWSAEGLLAMPVFNDVVGKKIAIFRGEGGRELLEPVLTSRGAIVTSVMVYRRVIPENCHPERSEGSRDPSPLSLLENIDAIICSSYTSVDHLKKMVGEAGWPVLKTIPLIVMSERIKTLAHDLGFQTIWVAKNASHVATMETIAQKRNELCQKKQINQQ